MSNNEPMYVRHLRPRLVFTLTLSVTGVPSGLENHFVLLDTSKEDTWPDSTMLVQRVI